MSFDYKHNLDDIIEPKTLEYLFRELEKTDMENDLLAAPFVRVEHRDFDRIISFWSLKDTPIPDGGEVDMGVSYCWYFLKLCGRHRSFALLPLIVAGMVKSGKFGEVEIAFIEYLAQFMIMGFGAYNLACWISEEHGGLGQPDFSWLVETPKKK